MNGWTWAPCQKVRDKMEIGSSFDCSVKSTVESRLFAECYVTERRTTLGAVPACRISYGRLACLLNIREEIWHCSRDFSLGRLNDEAAQLTSMTLYPIAVVMHITHRLRSEPVKQSAAFNRVITLWNSSQYCPLVTLIKIVTGLWPIQFTHWISTMDFVLSRRIAHSCYSSSVHVCSPKRVHCITVFIK